MKEFKDLNFTTDQLTKAEKLSSIIKNLSELGVNSSDEVSSFIKMANGLKEGQIIFSNSEGIVDEILWDKDSNNLSLSIINKDTNTIHFYDKLLNCIPSKGKIIKVEDKLGEVDGELSYKVLKLE